MGVWLVWLVLAVVLGVAEVLALTPVLGILGAAALITLIAAAVGIFGAHPAWGFFVVVSVVGVVTIRPVVRKHWQPPSIHVFGPAAHAGKTARMVHEIHGESGRVRIDGGRLDRTHLRRSPGHPGRHGGRRAGDQRRHRPRLPQGMIMNALLVIGVVLVLFFVITILRSVRIVPQGHARNVERLGRYHRTLQPGMSFVVPFVDRVCPMMELREQVVSLSRGR